jgi:hypothetical protein
LKELVIFIISSGYTEIGPIQNSSAEYTIPECARIRISSVYCSTSTLWQASTPALAGLPKSVLFAMSQYTTVHKIILIYTVSIYNYSVATDVNVRERQVVTNY